MPQKFLQSPAQANNVVPVTVEGTDITFYAPKGAKPEQIIELARRAVEENVGKAKAKEAQESGQPMIGPAPSKGMQVATGLLPDALSAAASYAVPGGGIVKTIASMLGGATGEGIRQAVTGDHDPMGIPLATVAQGLPPGIGRGVKQGMETAGNRLFRQAFKTTAKHEARFPGVNVMEEVTGRRLLPDKASIDALQAEYLKTAGARQAAAAGQHVPTYDAISSLLDLRAKLEPLAKYGRADLSEIDQLIDMVQKQPHSGKFFAVPGGGVSRSIPATEALDVKVGSGMMSDPAFNAQMAGKYAGQASEINKALTGGMTDALDAVPGVSEASKKLQAIKAIKGPLKTAEHRERTRPLIDPRFLVGAGMAGMGVGSLLGPEEGAGTAAIAVPLGLLATSPRMQAQAGYLLRSGSKLPLEETLRLILAGGGAAIDQGKDGKK